MVLIIIFLLGLILGISFTRLIWRKSEIKRERNIFSDETDLKATPDGYLSEVDLLKKRYLEARDRKIWGTLKKPIVNRTGIPMTEEEIKLRNLSGQ